MVQYHKGIQVQTLDSNKADTWTLVLSYLLICLHYHMQLVPSRTCLIPLYSTAVCNVDFVAKACAITTSSIIDHKVPTAKPTYLYIRDRESYHFLTPRSPLHSKPWENPTHLYNQPSWIYIWVLLFFFSILAYFFITPGIVTCWRWGSQVSYGQPGCCTYTAGNGVAMLFFLCLRTEKHWGKSTHLRYVHGCPQSHIFLLF